VNLGDGGSALEVDFANAGTTNDAITRLSYEGIGLWDGGFNVYDFGIEAAGVKTSFAGGSAK